MAREDLTQLYRLLMGSRFGFLGQGAFLLSEIYAVVKERYPKLCDDTYPCSVNCQSDHTQPEWRHVVRKALTDLKRRGSHLSYSQRHWVVGLKPLGSPDPTAEEFTEGRELLQLHRKKERNPRAVRQKKRQVFAAHGRLCCEVCGFDFAQAYGPLGAGFAECHHRVPLSQLAENHGTRLSDLAIVCANCHRMLYRRPMHSVDELRNVVEDLRAPVGEVT